MDDPLNFLLQMMQMMQPQDTEYSGNNQPPYRMLQALLPFLPPEHQKNFGEVFRLMELQKALTDFTNQAVNRYSPDCGDWRHHLLVSIRPHMPERKQLMLDLLIKMIEMNALIERMRCQSTC